MNYLDYIQHRMKMKGYRDYSIMPFDIKTDEAVNEYEIPAYNEFYYLVNEEVPEGVMICSDTHIYQADEFNAQQQLKYMNEFTGLITIHLPAGSEASQFEFIRVIPN